MFDLDRTKNWISCRRAGVFALCLGACVGCAADEPGKALEVRASKCDDGGDSDGEDKVSLVQENGALSLDASLSFNCIVHRLCGYELDQDNPEQLDVLLAPCDPEQREVAKCMCRIAANVDLPDTQAKTIRVFRHGVYRPGQAPDRRLMAELSVD